MDPLLSNIDPVKKIIGDRPASMGDKPASSKRYAHVESKVYESSARAESQDAIRKNKQLSTGR